MATIAKARNYAAVTGLLYLFAACVFSSLWFLAGDTYTSPSQVATATLAIVFLLNTLIHWGCALIIYIEECDN